MSYPCFLLITYPSAYNAFSSLLPNPHLSLSLPRPQRALSRHSHSLKPALSVTVLSSLSLVSYSPACKASRAPYWVRTTSDPCRFPHTHSYPSSAAADPSLRRSFMSDVCHHSLLAPPPSHVHVHVNGILLHVSIVDYTEHESSSLAYMSYLCSRLPVHHE